MREDILIDCIGVQVCLESTEIEILNLGVVALVRDLVDKGKDFIEQRVVVGADLDDKAKDCEGLIFVKLSMHEIYVVRGKKYVPAPT